MLFEVTAALIDVNVAQSKLLLPMEVKTAMVRVTAAKQKLYIQMIDYALWEVMENGNTAPKTIVVKGVEKVLPLTTIEEKAHKRLEVKARSTLMMGIPNEHLLKFNSINEVKLPT
ncbi:hypothetical protein Tco_0933760 [Tanacetum coccineum]